MNKIIHGDAIEEMKKMETNSVDTIITDPPAGISFMGKSWDSDKGGRDKWIKWFGEVMKECYRVAKPGATALVWALPRTSHWTAFGIEEGGWVIKDCIYHMFGSGFPKASDISKQLDKRNGRELKQYKELGKYLKEKRSNKPQKEISRLFLSKTGRLTGCVANWELGFNVPTKKQWVVLKRELGLDDRFDELINRVEAEREIIGKKKGVNAINEGGVGGMAVGVQQEGIDVDITEPATEEAKLWNGWKSHGLKPAVECWWVAMKSNEGTYAENAIKWGVSGLWIDGARIGNETIKHSHDHRSHQKWKEQDGRKTKIVEKGIPTYHQGRFPANLILDEEAAKILDKQSGERPSSGKYKKTGKWKNTGQGKIRTWDIEYDKLNKYAGDKGGASRFFKVI